MISAVPVSRSVLLERLTEKKMVGQGRPWEVTKTQTTCPFCGTGCSFDLNVKDGKVIGVTSNPDAPVNGKALCVKGRFGMDMIYSLNRVTTPLIRKDGVLVPAEWDEALDLVAKKFREIKDSYGADRNCGVKFCPLHERRKLPHAKIHARCHRDQQR